ncbi:MAG TPA: hypothetical protein VEH04_12355 [Verrucomicrobiae bacterium]|nr:hypothetical protein [Verrucomicrobiae bacterium]
MAIELEIAGSDGVLVQCQERAARDAQAPARNSIVTKKKYRILKAEAL